MISQNFEQAMTAIRQGDMDTGRRLLQVVLHEEALPPHLQAVALLWLAETTPDNQAKIQLYRQASTLDPQNQDIAQRLALLLAAQLPPAPAVNAPSAMPPVNPNITYAPSTPAPLEIPIVQRSVLIRGGVNGDGTGFFITQQGLIATTRHVVGTNTAVEVELVSHQVLQGEVVRSFLSLDLVFIRVNATVRQLPIMTTSPMLMDDTPLLVTPHLGNPLRTAKRPTREALASHWIPTFITAMPDAGGAPIYDERGVLVGMMTNNHFATNEFCFGLHISAIYQCNDQYQQDLQRTNGQHTYCPSCGSLSNGKTYQAPYCETCGAVLPYAQNQPRQPMPQLGAFYGEVSNSPCPKCGARAGYYNGKCLRCENIINTN